MVELVPGYFSTNINIPLAPYDAILPGEEQEQIIRMKSDKACGSDGEPLGLLKTLPGQWSIMITTMFNMVFNSNVHPKSWSKVKLFTIYK